MLFFSCIFAGFFLVLHKNAFIHQRCLLLAHCILTGGFWCLHMTAFANAFSCNSIFLNLQLQSPIINNNCLFHLALALFMSFQFQKKISLGDSGLKMWKQLPCHFGVVLRKRRKMCLRPTCKLVRTFKWVFWKSPIFKLTLLLLRSKWNPGRNSKAVYKAIGSTCSPSVWFCQNHLHPSSGGQESYSCVRSPCREAEWDIKTHKPKKGYCPCISLNFLVVPPAILLWPWVRWQVWIFSHPQLEAEEGSEPWTSHIKGKDAVWVELDLMHVILVPKFCHRWASVSSPRWPWAIRFSFHQTVNELLM